MKTGNVEQMLKEFSDGTYDLTDNGKCTQCGQCCSNILPMTEDEISVIRRYIKKHHIKEHKHMLPLAESTIDMTCPFLDDSKSCEKCTIYEVRPMICRDFICDPKQRPTIRAEKVCAGALETVKIKQATKQGYIECELGGVADLSYPNSNTRRCRVQDNGQVSPTLTAGEQDICRIEKEVDCEEGVSIEILRILRREIGEKDFSEWAIRGLWCVLQEEILQQNLYAKGIYENWTHRPELFKFAYNSKGNQYSIHSEKAMRNMWEEWTVRCTPQGRGLSEQQCREFDDFMSKLPYETTQRKELVHCLWKASEGIGLLREALSEIQKVWEPTNYQEMQRCTYRIRKLTPLSCWRLMDFSDEDFEKAAEVNSNTQLYKQAGNSIVKNVLVAILGQMIPGKENVYKELNE